MTTVYTNESSPSLVVATLSGEIFDLSTQNPEHFTIIVFYRGRQCPTCMGQLKEVEGLLAQATKQGIHVIAISMDTREKALESVAIAQYAISSGAESDEKKEVASSFNLPIGYGMTEAQARSWGLYISCGRNEKEPPVFSEPGMYVIRADNTVYFAQTQSSPFTRPNFQQLLEGLQYVVDHNYPTRGTLTKKE